MRLVQNGTIKLVLPAKQQSTATSAAGVSKVRIQPRPVTSSSGVTSLKINKRKRNSLVLLLLARNFTVSILFVEIVPFVPALCSLYTRIYYVKIV